MFFMFSYLQSNVFNIYDVNVKSGSVAAVL